jgi:colanic acid/amylovoran biosynthesis glycosyltransferase
VVKKSPSQGKLAVVVPHSGQSTETFIRRYCEQLASENTVIVHFYHGADVWVPDCPTFFFQDAFFGSAKLARVYRGFQKALGIGSLFGDPYTAGALKSFLLKNHVSVVFSQYLVTGWNIHRVVQSMGLKHVVRGHGFDLSAALGDPTWRQRYLEIESANAIIVPTPFQIQRLRDIGMKNANLISLPCGIDIPESQLIGRQCGTMVKFFFAGRLVPKKGPLLLVRAFLMAAEQNPEICLIIGGDGPLSENLKSILAEHPLGNRVQLLGRLAHSEVLRYMQEADVYIQHSITDPDNGDQEGAPVAIMEAMGHGLPVISTLHSGIPYLVEDGVTGFLSKESDVSGMMQNILRIAAAQALRLEMGKNSRIRASELTWDMEKQQLLKILKL